MGQGSSKPEETNTVSRNQFNEEGGLHLVEFHLPSAGYGFIMLTLLIVGVLGVYLIYRRCIVEPRKKREKELQGFPLSIMRYHARAGMTEFDNGRFEEIPPARGLGRREDGPAAGNGRLHEAV